MRPTLLIPALFLLTIGCSAYQNAGRKFLEKDSYDRAGLKFSAGFKTCDAPADDGSWVIEREDFQSRTKRRDRPDGAFDLRIETFAADDARACEFTFGSAEERAELTPLAIELANGPARRDP